MSNRSAKNHVAIQIPGNWMHPPPISANQEHIAIQMMNTRVLKQSPTKIPKALLRTKALQPQKPHEQGQEQGQEENANNESVHVVNTNQPNWMEKEGVDTSYNMEAAAKLRSEARRAKTKKTRRSVRRRRMSRVR